MHIPFKEFLNPEFYITYGGLWVVLLIVFAETGLMVGFFLPGDSLLFVAGIYSNNLIKSLFVRGTGFAFLDLFVLIILIAASGTFGNLAGYWIGKKGGVLLFKRKDTFLFKKRHLLQAKNFYDRHGALAIILARFLPIIRTFAPIVAGIVKMDLRKFIYYSIVGVIGWAFLMLLSGHYLYVIFLKHFNINIKNNLEYIVIGIVLITTLPVLYKIVIKKKVQ